MDLIDKSAVVAEIERRMEELYELLPDASKVENGAITISESCNTGKYTTLESFSKFLDTLAVKEVDLEDVSMVDRETAREKSILDETRVEYFATGKPTIAAYSEDNLRNQFDAGAYWMKEQIIKALR